MKLNLKSKKYDPFHLNFNIKTKEDKVFVSDESNLYLIPPMIGGNIFKETINLEKWGVDEIESVYVETKFHNQKIHLSFLYHIEEKELEIIWSQINDRLGFNPEDDSKLVIRFYSVSQMREKLLNELFDEKEYK